MIRTVQGDLELPVGPMLGHEHLHIDLSHHRGVDDVLDETAQDAVIADLKHVMRAHDVRAVVDLSVIGGGRNVKALRHIAELTGLAVVGATGFYWQPMPAGIGEAPLEHLRDTMIREIEHGVDGTGIHCGTIKIGTGNGPPNAMVERLFRAAAAAALASGACLVTHTSAPEQAVWHLDVLADAGMDLSRVLIGHMHRFPRFADFAAIAARGSFMGIDQVGSDKPAADEHLADIAAQAVAAGFCGRLIISSDVARRSRLSANGGGGYATTFASFLPLLRQRGVTNDQIGQIMCHNPRELYALHPGVPPQHA